MPDTFSTSYVLLPGYKCPYRAVEGTDGKPGQGGYVQVLHALGTTKVLCRHGHLYDRSAILVPVYTWEQDS